MVVAGHPVRELLGPLSLANRKGEAYRARRRVVGQLLP